MSTVNPPAAAPITRLAILAGRGTLPLELADAAARRGIGVHIVALRGFAEPTVARYSHTWVGLGQVGHLLAAIRSTQPDALVILGGIDRPDLWTLLPDLGFLRHFTSIATVLRGGDDAVLRRVVRFFEGQAITVAGVGDVAPELLMPEGALAGDGLDAAGRASVATALGAIAALAPHDVGQAAIAEAGRLIAVEAADGTDALLARVAASGPASGVGARVLVKAPKTGQDLRIDLPAIGAATVERCVAAHIGFVAVPAGCTLVSERVRLEAAAHAGNVGIVGLGAAEIAAAADRDHLAAGATSHAPVILPPRDTAVMGHRRLAVGPLATHDRSAAADALAAASPYWATAASLSAAGHVMFVAPASDGPATLAAMAQRLARKRGPLRRRIGAVMFGHGRENRDATAGDFTGGDDAARWLAQLAQAIAVCRLSSIGLSLSTPRDALAWLLPEMAGVIAAADRAGTALLATPQSEQGVRDADRIRQALMAGRAAELRKTMCDELGM